MPRYGSHSRAICKKRCASTPCWWPRASCRSRRACVEALSELEPHVPWRLSVLSWRSRCYEAQKPAWAGRAARELDEYLSGEAAPFGLGLTNVELR